MIIHLVKIENFNRITFKDSPILKNYGKFIKENKTINYKNFDHY